MYVKGYLVQQAGDGHGLSDFGGESHLSRTVTVVPAVQSIPLGTLQFCLTLSRRSLCSPALVGIRYGQKHYFHHPFST